MREETGTGAEKSQSGRTRGMDAFVKEQDFALLRADRISFSVLDSILRGPCVLLRSDHRRLILCHSTPPYPVWIWTADGLGAEEKEYAWRLAEELCPLSDGYRLMLKYELADFFVGKAKEAGLNAGISKELLSYDCPTPIKPTHRAGGGLQPCQAGELTEAAALLTRFYAEVGEHPLPKQTVLEKTAQKIAEAALFFWKDPAGRTAACGGWRHSEGLATITDVYTLPEFRRRHCAQNLVYELTRRAKEAGFLPVLYTNANYPASNACYQKIGYRLRGRLCTVSLL